MVSLSLFFGADALAQAPLHRRINAPKPSDATAAVLPSLPHAKVPKPADFKSAHFLIHTDLSGKEAHQLLARLESMLGLIAKYWGHPPLGTIECYIVKNLSVWPAGSLHPTGLAKIQDDAGITMVETLNRGPMTVAAKAVVYAVADHGTPQHEAVHAYCGQTFGTTGPLWYSEGMAEMGQYWRQGDTSVRCPDYVVQYIRAGRPKPLSEILREDGSPRGGTAMTGDSWQNYAWRWALCHMLENNPNYTTRFRALGLGFLTNQRVSFGDSFGSMLGEIAFEYRFFVAHLEQGYRVDLCSWDWKRKFVEAGDTPISSRIVANRGWQPTGAMVKRGEKYDYSVSGTWQVRKNGPQMTADGDDAGTGRLEGIVFQDFTLGEPIAMGAYGSMPAPEDGQLYVRCRDRWNALADNRGSMAVKIKRAESGRPLARPAQAIAKTGNDAEE